MKPMKVERGSWTAKGGTVNERIFLRYVHTKQSALSFSFAELDAAEQLARDLLRLVAEWKAEMGEQGMIDTLQTDGSHRHKTVQRRRGGVPRCL